MHVSFTFKPREYYRLGLIFDACGEIINLLIELINPLDRTRISNCQTDIEDVHEKIIFARNAIVTQSYGKRATILTAAQQKIIECNDKYESLPKRESTISNYTSIIAKLIDIYILL